MTELEQKAEEYLDTNFLDYGDISISDVKIAYKDGYEQGQNFQRGVFAENCSRCSKKKIESVTEKNSEVEELKEELKNYAKVINERMILEENEELKDLLNRSNFRLAEEQLKNEELKAQIKDLCESLDIMNNQESELLAQIEKMKCCGNCNERGAI